MTRSKRILTLVAALLGAAGVAAAAGSSHAGGSLLGPLSLIALSHAPALLALGLAAPPGRSFAVAGGLMAGGATLFCTDLAARWASGSGLFPMAAPLGGAALIAGWLGLALAALLARTGR